MESGAPVVSIAGGEPFMHPQIDVMINELIKRKKYVVLCTNAELIRKRWDRFDLKPSEYLSFAIHVDGLRERHDESVSKEGVFDEAMEAIKFLKAKGFTVTTNSTFFNTDTPQTIIDVLNMLNDDVQVDSMMISPAYAYEKAPDQDHFLGVTETRELFKKAFGDGNRKRWRLNHSPLFLDFLEGKQDFACTAWGIPSYSLLGWQKPCYLMNDGYVKTYKELVETTDWEKYGRGKRRALQQLHGALRLRAHRGARDHGVAQGRHPRTARAGLILHPVVPGRRRCGPACREQLGARTD